MTLWGKIRALISGIDDPKVRTDVAATINFLIDTFAHGGISEEQLRSDLTEVVGTVIETVNPLLTPDEVKARAEVVADDFIRTAKVESLHYRIRARIRQAERLLGR
jgi:hypothetical protein